MISFNFLPRFSRTVTTETRSAGSVAVLVLSVLFSMIIFLTGATASWGVQFPPVVDLADTTADVTILGAAEGERTGIGLTSGDYDGDSFNDFAVLSSGQSNETSGAFIHVFWGRSPLAPTIDLLTYQGDLSKILAPAGAHGFLSARIASGDFNGDGYDDMVLGLREAAPGVYIIFGSASFADTLRLSNPVSPVTTVVGAPGISWLGAALAVGDVNGDTYADLVIGAPASSVGGRVYLIYGRSTFPPTIQLGQTQPGITRIIEPYDDQRTGTGLACEDVDKDGFDDLLIGSPGYYEGLVTLLFGSDALPDTITLWDSTVEAMGMKRFWGAYSYGELGWRVAIGDLEDDGVEELIFSALYANPLGCENCGEIYVVSWNPNLPDSVNVGSTTVPVKRLIGLGADTVYGRDLVVADVTGDRLDDVLVSRDPDLGDPSDVRDVTVVYGSASLPDSIFLGTDTLVTRFLDAARGDGLGRGLGVGDVNSDGNNDVLLGAYAASPLGRTVAGKAYVFYGTADASGVGAVSARNTTLYQNYPNPFNPTTTISFSIPKPTCVQLEIFDVRGALVRTLVDAEKQPSFYRIPWDGRDNSGHEVASGVYFCRLTAGEFVAAKKLVLLR